MQLSRKGLLEPKKTVQVRHELHLTSGCKLTHQLACYNCLSMSLPSWPIRMCCEACKWELVQQELQAEVTFCGTKAAACRRLLQGCQPTMCSESLSDHFAEL